MGKEESGASKLRGIVYVVCLLGVFIEAGFFAAHRRQSAGQDVSQAREEVIVEHPIPELMTAAEDRFRNMLQSQSKTLEQAVAEYKRRYGRDPPKGFDDWFAFAMAKDVKMIDEYDAINEDLSPFYAFSGEELRRRVDQVCTIAIDLKKLRMPLTGA